MIKRVFNFLKKIFLEHPNSVGESYFVHLFWAMLFGVHLLVAGLACIVHAVFPFVFTETASSIAEWVVNTSRDRRRYD